jgi:hypothetical protein
MNHQAITGIMLQNRKAVKKILDIHSIEQINQIPSGFNNNIIWQAGHILSVQQMLSYGLAGLPFTIPDEMVSKFAPGTRPEKFYDEEFKNLIQTLFIDSYHQLVSDVETGRFNQISPFMTALKYEITDFEGAISFNLFHEAMHMGHILNLRRSIR